MLFSKLPRAEKMQDKSGQAGSLPHLGAAVGEKYGLKAAKEIIRAKAKHLKTDI